jgi:hypothetical protein
MQDSPSRRVAKPEDIVLAGDWCLVDNLIFTASGELKHNKRAFVMRCPHCRADGAFPIETPTFWQRVVQFFKGFKTNAAFVCVQNATHIFVFDNGRLIPATM